MRLIDADELMQRCYQELKECTGEDFKEGIRWMLVDVVELSTVDVVPVVRCRDCKHRRGDGFCKKYQRNIDGSATMWFAPDDDWFCADGEKVSK